MNTESVNKLYAKKDLTENESRELFNSVFNGDVSPVMLSSILTALKLKGETSDEIAGAAASMRQFSVKPEIQAENMIDTCGTGGDSSHSFNISSASAIILSAMKYNVAKHGNRSVTSKSGSADFYEALGVPVNLTGDEAAAYFKKHNFLFMFAPNYHPAMKYAGPVRKEIKTRTIFNYLGPLTNPAGTKKQVIGVFHPEFLPLYAETAVKLGFERIMLYSGKSGMDEISPYEETVIYDVKNGIIEKSEMSPEKYISRSEAESIPNGLDAVQNANLFIKTLEFKEESPLAKLLAMNAALALKCAGYGDDYDANYSAALKVIVDGTVKSKLEELTAK
ncbi:MAG: anthranilate phosphoribosyltransferase [Spirochaetes bacterium]|nr:anthranilate phosphoribosyltransferase [Spirochaetota bacterium]